MHITLPPGVVPGAAAPVAGATPIVSPAAAAPAPPSDAIDDRTRVAPPRRPRAAWKLVLPDGAEHPLVGSTVVGRQPSATAASEGVHELAIEDPDDLMSKSHAVFVVDASGVGVRDLDSTNGVVVVRPDGTESQVESSSPTVLADGDEVELGTYVVTLRRI